MSEAVFRVIGLAICCAILNQAKPYLVDARDRFWKGFFQLGENIKDMWKSLISRIANRR